MDPDHDEVERTCFKFALWLVGLAAAVLLVAAYADEPEFDCITDMECEMKYGPQ